MGEKLKMVIKPGGEIKFLHKKGADELRKAFNSKIDRVQRISNIETFIQDGKSIGWYIDFSLIGGKTLFHYGTYEKAVAKEIEIIEEMHGKGVTSMGNYNSPLIQKEIQNGKIYDDLNNLLKQRFKLLPEE